MISNETLLSLPLVLAGIIFAAIQVIASMPRRREDVNIIVRNIILPYSTLLFLLLIAISFVAYLNSFIEFSLLLYVSALILGISYFPFFIFVYNCILLLDIVYTRLR